MFDCGIDRVVHEISNQIMQQEENTVVRVVQEAGYSINKEQLTKALTDSKSFYNQGYEDGYTKGRLDAALEIYNHINEIYNLQELKDEDC